ncbi:hypothetical protein SAMN05660420_00114 [Desulfuromusa kysingii]|uniref:Uncharacterized protein n=1 Tax=Desulfuromusa kysingii TaxID=37625 RepID=A0A1H3VJS7_9BACT|nr:hypothetical protein [Desulfuromusa kysingii]SDZ75030.1 hypothetical protein SAMN05660420_00114 [Desulfuromusa kysingii]
MTFKDLIWPIVAFTSYICGGLLTFGGAGLIIFMKGKDLWGWGEGHALGYLFVCVGLVLSILGVLIMRILRNRI